MVPVEARQYSPVEQPWQVQANRSETGARFSAGAPVGGGSDGVSIANPVGSCKIIRVYRIGGLLSHSAAGTGLPFRVRRITAQTGGASLMATPYQARDLSGPGAVADCRTAGAVTEAANSNPYFYLGGASVLAAGLSGPQTWWQAYDFGDMIRLAEGEGIVVRSQAIIAVDADDQLCIDIHWRED